MSERLTLENAGEMLGMAFREKVDRLRKDVDLDAFESLVLSQKPASVPWTPVTDYSFEARKAIEGIHPQLIKDVFQPLLVVDVGCGPDAHLCMLLDLVRVFNYGIDPQVRRYVSIGDRQLYLGDICTLFDDASKAWQQGDLVICREVLEHLTVRQIRKAVTNLCALSSKFVYCTTRYCKNPQSLLDVDTSDELDPTHISMLNQDLLRVLFILEGFRRRADLEERMDWQQKGRVLVYERAV